MVDTGILGSAAKGCGAPTVRYSADAFRPAANTHATTWVRRLQVAFLPVADRWLPISGLNVGERAHPTLSEMLLWPQQLNESDGHSRGVIPTLAFAEGFGRALESGT